MPIGTFINVASVLIGGTVGLLLKTRFPLPLQQIAMQSIGLITIIIGVDMALRVENLVLLIFSLLFGSIFGQLINLKELLEKASTHVKQITKSNDTNFVEGLTTAFLIFCIGSMTILGSINEGVSQDRSLLYTKSVLDGFTAIALSATYGIGVIFSTIPLFFYQSALTVFAGNLKPFMSPFVIVQLSAAGGILILGFGINLLNIKRIVVTNMLPSLLFSVIFALLAEMV